jgi:hypothetical protein
MIFLSSLLLLVAGVTALLASLLSVVGVPSFPEVLTVAGFPAIVASLVSLAFLLTCCYSNTLALVITNACVVKLG